MSTLYNVLIDNNMHTHGGVMTTLQSVLSPAPTLELLGSREHPTSINEMVVTPQIAREWLNDNKFSYQRKLRPAHVSLLANEMKANEFREFTEIVFAFYQGNWYLLDGQHRLNAVIESGRAIRFMVIKEYHTSMESISYSYTKIDQHAIRTPIDSHRANGLHDKFGLALADVSQLGTAVRLLGDNIMRSSKVKTKTDQKELTERMTLYAPSMKEYLAIAATATGLAKRNRNRASLIAVALLSFKFSKPWSIARNKPSVEDFWSGMLRDDGLKVGDPRKTANYHLVTTKIISDLNENATHRTKDGFTIIPPSYHARYIIGCFNAWMDGREHSRSLVPDSKAPISMRGVPTDMEKWFE